ncbi:unnamed protein product, partial [Brassica rapa subsp. narinosa]
MVVFRRENCSILTFFIFFVGFWANPFIASNGGNPKTIRIRGFNRMDPAEERRHSKRQNDYINRLGSVVDSEYGIPRRCPCGGRIIDEADGFHYRQPWVIGVQEEIERLTKRLEEAEQVMLGTLNLSKQIETLE